MCFRVLFAGMGLLIGTIVVGCGSGPTGGPKTPPKPSVDRAVIDGARFLLATEPAAAKSVVEARKQFKNDDEVAIVGRIGGDVKPWVEGRASFLIVDSSLKPCNERPGDTCPTPWDYCCDTDVLPKSKATIKFVDEQGKTVPTDARKLLGIKELQTIVVQGRAKRDEAGNLTVHASGLFVRK